LVAIVQAVSTARVQVTLEIEDDDALAIMRRYGISTTTEAIDLALQNLAGQPMTREEALAMRGAPAIDDLPGG